MGYTNKYIFPPEFIMSIFIYFNMFVIVVSPYAPTPGQAGDVSWPI